MKPSGLAASLVIFVLLLSFSGCILPEKSNSMIRFEGEMNVG